MTVCANCGGLPHGSIQAMDERLADMLDEVTTLAELLANRCGHAGCYPITFEARALLELHSTRRNA